MINLVNIDLTNNSCWGATNVAGSDNEINLCIKLLADLLNKTDIHLEFTKPDGVIITTDNLTIDKELINYEIPFNLYVTQGILKLRILATDYASDYINFNINNNYTETDDLCVKFNSTTKEFNINKCETADKTVKIGVRNYLENSQEEITMVRPSTFYSRYWWANKHPLALKTTSIDHTYTLSFKFVPEAPGYVPASSIVLGGIKGEDAWDIRLFNYDKALIENYEDYYIYSYTFTIKGDGKQYLQNNIGFILESSIEGTGGIVSEIKLEEGENKTGWIPILKDEEELKNLIKTNSLQNYSTEEQLIGTWINGKPLYRKTIPFTTGTSYAQWLQYAHGIPNVEHIMVTSPTFLWDNKRNVSLPDLHTQFGANSTYIEYVILTEGSGYGNKPIWITVEYTKTTD